MGITIDKTIEFFNTLEYLNTKDKEAKDVAIDTMRKYQKIQEIVQSKTTRLSYDIGFSQIKKVVEDGIDDN